MIIDCCGDLHGHYPKLEGGDLLIICGDLTASDTQKQIDKFDDWLTAQKYRKKIFIGGNHDNSLIIEKPRKYLIRYGNNCTEKFEYLCDSGTEFEGLKIYGSPWSKTFPGMNPKCKAFTVDTEEELAEKWGKIPSDLDILITHSPPYGILDQNVQGEYCGSKSLLETIHRINPSLVVYGHIHEFGLRKKIENDILFVNSSFVDERYKPRNGFMKCHYQDSLFTDCSTLTLMK